MAAGSTSSSSGNQQKLTAGSRVSCTTYNGEKVEGEVLAFDNHHKILVLKLPSSSGERGTCNINFLNVELLRDHIDIIEEVKKSPSQLPPLDMNKIMARTEYNLKERQKHSERIGIGVSGIGQLLFDLVSKTFNNCDWDDKVILVKSADVRIVPPYKADNIQGDPKAVDHIKKLVEKVHAEQETTL